MSVTMSMTMPVPMPVATTSTDKLHGNKRYAKNKTKSDPLIVMHVVFKRFLYDLK
jgi:hypothetical protein